MAKKEFAVLTARASIQKSMTAFQQEKYTLLDHFAEPFSVIFARTARNHLRLLYSSLKDIYTPIACFLKQAVCTLIKRDHLDPWQESSVSTLRPQSIIAEFSLSSTSWDEIVKILKR